MKMLISGGGDVGRATAETMINSGHDITLIEEHRDICERLSAELDIMVICGDATRPNLLEKAGIEKTDMVIALSGDDKMNILTALVAKEYGVKRVIVKLDDPAFNIVCQKLGVEEIVNPKVATAKHIAAMARKPHAIELSTLVGGAISVFTTIIHKDEHVGKRIDCLNLPDGVLAAVVQRANEFFIAKGDLKIMYGDHLSILCEEKTLDALNYIFT